MKRKFVVVAAALMALTLVTYFALPGLLVKWARDSERKSAGLQQKSVRVGDHEIAYLGHLPMIERPQEAAERYRVFLKDQQPFR